ncbi:hypothetical protein LOTGIDRAFT_152736 [Lottia gigantea]|uniref:Uncharacterized protein n=1 Tax=Lottia gigantea TaxID=225164 RepID=V4C7H4_LOTGI|nr:hypothetical protein LOTGIDRAFT_152736 [Lottia gigantea]ESO97644.1 hypothetical protein LOTGIDRAFT_152736 [Lottia gigantea]
MHLVTKRIRQSAQEAYKSTERIKMICLFMIAVVLAVCNAQPKRADKLSLKGGAVDAINNIQVPLVEKMSFPVGTNGGNPGNQPLVAKSSYPDTYSDAMIRALAFMAEGNVALEQDDNGTPNNPFDDLYVMISELGERVNLSYNEIIMIRDVNHRLNSIFETTPGSVTPAITTVIRGASNSGQQRVLSANSRSMSFNIGQSRSGNSEVGTAQIGYIPSRKVGQSVTRNAFAANMQFGSGNTARNMQFGSGNTARNMQFGSGNSARNMQFGSGNSGVNVGGLNAFQQQQMYKMQMIQRLQAMRYGMLSRMFLRPMIHPVYLRRFPF